MTHRVLLVDDDARLHELLAAYLSQNGFEVTGAADGRKGLDALETGSFDVVLLDVMMPGLDGIEVCRRIRATSRIPIVMLTAKGDETDRVVGLELGADDYVAKPFSPRELLARLRALLRRAAPRPASDLLTVGALSLDVDGRVVTVSGRAVELTGVEFDILVDQSVGVTQPVKFCVGITEPVEFCISVDQSVGVDQPVGITQSVGITESVRIGITVASTSY